MGAIQIIMSHTSVRRYPNKEILEDALKIPRLPYEVLYEGSYSAVAKSDMLKMLVWDSYS